MTFKVLRLLQVISSAILCTFVQQVTRFQLTTRDARGPSAIVERIA